MLGSEQSLAYIFQEICDSSCGECLFLFSFFCLIYNPCLLCSVFLPNKACWSLHTTQFLKYYHTVVDREKSYLTTCSNMTITLYIWSYFWPQLLNRNSFIEFINRTLFIIYPKNPAACSFQGPCYVWHCLKIKNVFLCPGALNNRGNNYSQYYTDAILN